METAMIWSVHFFSAPSRDSRAGEAEAWMGIVRKAVQFIAVSGRQTLIVLAVLICIPASAGTPGRIVLESSHLRLTLDSTGRNVGFTDLATGTDYLDKHAESSFAQVQTSGATLSPTRVALTGQRLALEFAHAKFKAILRIETNSTHITIAVESLEGPGVESFTFLNIPLRLQASPEEPFGACALGLTVNTRIRALPALQRHLQASCEAKFGMIGAKAAVVAAPMQIMLPSLQSTLEKDSELPVCKVAGPWANQVPFNHGSYLFNYGELMERNVDKWIGMVKHLGFNQVDNHGGSPEFFRFGDMALNPGKWPDGWESQRRIVSRLKQAGIGSILHTYAFFIDKQARYVTPVPDRRLDAFREFTLAEPLSADATEIKVNESTAGIVTATGFFEHNSVILHVNDELVTFDGVSQQAPWGFTGVKRGALGTQPAAHARGAKARHLKECFGLLVPDVNSSLFEEIAANHAEVVNLCGFDGIYLDAIDGSAILRGPDECWYWADKFIVEIQKRLNRPVGMEMSAMWHHSWQYRARGRAWDYPRRGQKRFIDIHAERENGSLMLPPHLGWWAFQAFAPPQIEPCYPEVIEHLGARMIGWNAGISLAAGLDERALHNTPLFQRAADTLRICETLRHAKAFDATARAKLRDPQYEFTLDENLNEQVRFLPTQSRSHTASLAEPWTLAWGVTNSFARQPMRLRLESLIGVSSTPQSEKTIIADFDRNSIAEWKVETARGVMVRIAPTPNADAAFGILTATNSGVAPRNAAWARIGKLFPAPVDLQKLQGIRVEVEGDGSGALLAIRLESPRHIAHGAIADRYIALDFTGRRQFDLVETESDRWSDYQWDDKKHFYHAYRELVDFSAIESISIWLHNLPTEREVTILIGPIQATELQSAVLRAPQITLSGNTVQFPIELASGGWIEANGPNDCIAYGRKGEVLKAIKPIGRWPELREGENRLELRYQPDPDARGRAKVVLFSRGEAINPSQ